MAKQLIIFGAGASYGSDNYNMPPLGSSLFFELQKFNHDGWGSINGNLAEIFVNDFEAGMVKVSEINSHALPVLQRAMAFYFFRFHLNLRKSNLYVKLAKLIANNYWNGALVTLNYELLLEMSLLYAGLQIYIGKPENSNQLELCYPHGCCHLFCESVKGSAGGVSFDGYGVSTTGKIKRVVDPKEHKERIRKDAFPPVMSYFEPKKRCSSGMNLIKNQRERLKNLILNASNIVLIGIRVRIHDNHIWDYLSQTNARLVYCSGDSAAKEFDCWKNEFRIGRDDLALHGYFADSFGQICQNVELVENSD